MGSSGAQALGLSSARTKNLELQKAWRQVAGTVLAQHASAVAVRRGVLDLVAEDPGWRRAVLHLLPELGARFSRHHAALGVTRFRFVTKAETDPAQ